MPEGAGHGRPVLFFGVNGEGLGHATRALGLLPALRRDHTVHVFCGGRAYALLSQHHAPVHRVWWGSITYRNNRMDAVATTLRTVLEGPWMLLSGLGVTLMALWLRPRAVLTDFECLTAWAGMLTFRRVVSVDNQQLLARANLPAPAPEDLPSRAVVARTLRWFAPRLDAALVPSFFVPQLKEGLSGHVRLVDPAVRPEVLRWQGRTRTDGAVVVYQTSPTNHALWQTLEDAHRATGLRFDVFGMPQPPRVYAGVRRRSFDTDGFLEAMASSPWVVLNGGHSAICEAMALGKPILCEPVANHYEQLVNAQAVAQVGAGQWCRVLTVDALLSFAQQQRAHPPAWAAPAWEPRHYPDAVLEALLEPRAASSVETGAPQHR